MTNVGLVEWIDASKVRSEVTGSPLKADDNASAPKIYEDLQLFARHVSATECCIWSWPNSELNDAFFGFLLPVAFRWAEFLTSSQHATALQMVWEPRHKRQAPTQNNSNFSNLKSLKRVSSGLQSSTYPVTKPNQIQCDKLRCITGFLHKSSNLITRRCSSPNGDDKSMF